MPESEATHLRIFCICGQKMKTSEEMFGRPGKCVACRQKIRIPRRDEIPEGVDEIYLKDHPEFLRKGPRRKKKPKEKSSHPVELRKGGEGEELESEGAEGAVAVAETPGEDVALGEESERVSTVPIDVLEPLRIICSAQYKLENQLNALDDVSSEESANRADVKGRLARVRALRADLDDQLRQILMEVAIELSGTMEKTVQTGLSARVGEITIDEYRETIDRLRRRRDRLERRQHNLRGWLATTDPHQAGGYLDLPYDNLPQEGFNVTLPADPEESQPLVHIHINALRNAFLARAHGERKLSELDRMQKSSEEKKPGLKEARADAKAEARMAEQTIAFTRDRLEQLSLDYDSDTETYEAQLDLARGRLQVGEIVRSQYDAIESELLRAKTDAAKARALIRRALNANSVQDVPTPKGTFLARLGTGGREQPIGVDVWIAWGAALFMGISIFLPAVNRFSMVEWFLEFEEVDALIRWYFIGPVVYAALVAFVASIPAAFVRGRVMAGLWLVATIIGAVAIHQIQFGLDPISAIFRVESYWVMQPGIFVLLCTHLAVLASIGLCLIAVEQERLIFAGAVLAAAALVGAVFTDLFGYLLPEPAVTVSATSAGAIGALPGEQDDTGQRHVITVSNDGPRTLHLVPASTDARGAYLFTVERQIGPQSWSGVPFPQADRGRAATFRNAGAATQETQRVLYSVPQNRSVNVVLNLEPATYRVLLQSNALNETIEVPFTVEPPPQSAPPPPPPRSQTEPAPEQSPQEGAGESGQPPPAESSVPENAVDARLIGVMAGEGQAPKFSFELSGEDGSESRMQVVIGEELRGPWTVVEYNPSLRAVTVGDGERVLILRVGDTVSLPE